MLKIQKLSCAALMLAVGALMGGQVKDLMDAQKEVIKYDNAQILAGLKDAIEGKVDVRKDEKIQQTLNSIEEKLVAAAKAKSEEQAKAAKEEGDKFRQEFAKQEGVKTTKDGLMYKIINEGKGAAIKPTDVVKVHYTGKLADGKVFDSSVERGSPAEFKLNQVVKGWTEGLQLVKKGGKIELVLPPELAYGEQGAGAVIPPNSTLFFEVEVLDVNPKATK